MTGLLGAVQFLTRIPVSLRVAAPHHRVVPWFPAVGALIGLAVGAAAAGLGELLPLPLAATLAIVLGLSITGAFHEDGLADCADAFGGGWTVEQRLEILKDSRHGTYGVVALIASIGVRIAAAATIVDRAALVAAFVAAHAIGRGAAVAAMAWSPAARDSGLGVDAARSLRPASTLVGLGAGVAASAFVAGWWVVPFVAAAAVGASVTVVLSVRKIGGIAGDVLGAIEQVVECLVLVVASGLAAHHAVWWG